MKSENKFQWARARIPFVNEIMGKYAHASCAPAAIDIRYLNEYFQFNMGLFTTVWTDRSAVRRIRDGETSTLSTCKLLICGFNIKKVQYNKTFIIFIVKQQL